MDKQLSSTSPSHVRSSSTKSHHLHSRIESQRSTSSDPAYSMIWTQPTRHGSGDLVKQILGHSKDTMPAQQAYPGGTTQEPYMNNSILLSALHHGPTVQRHRPVPQLTVPGTGNHGLPVTQHHMSPVGYQQNPRVPILQGPGLVNIIPSGQGATPSLSPELSRVPPHSQTSIAPLQVLHQTLPDLNMLNSLHLPNMADPTSANFHINRELSGLVNSDSRDDIPFRTKPDHDVAYEHLLKRDITKQIDSNTDVNERKGFDRALVFTSRNELVRNKTETTQEINSLFHKRGRTIQTCISADTVQPGSSLEHFFIQKRTCDRRPRLENKNNLNTQSKVAFVVDSQQNNGAVSNVTLFDGTKNDEKDFSSQKGCSKNASAPAEQSRKLPKHAHSTLMYPVGEKNLEGYVERRQNSGTQIKDNIFAKTDVQNLWWHLHEPDMYCVKSDSEQSSKISVCSASVVTVTTSVHLRPIQSVSVVDSKTQKPFSVTVAHSLSSDGTDQLSKFVSAHRSAKDVPFQNCSHSASSSPVKLEPSAHDLLEVARKARDSQKAHLDVIKKTLEQSNLGLSEPVEVNGNNTDKKEDGTQECVQSSQLLSTEEKDNLSEKNCAICSDVLEEEKELELKLLEEHQSALNKRPCILSNFPVSQTSFRTSYRSQAMAVHRAKMGSICTPVKSLDLLRQNLQKFINSELDSIVQKYMDMFFKPAVDNIRENSGVDAVSDDTIIMLCAQILEEAKKLYVVDHRSTTPEDIVSDPGSVTCKGALQEDKEIRASKRSLFHIKRRGSSDSDQSASRKRIKKTKTWSGLSGRSTPSKKSGLDPVKKEGPKWDPNRLTTETEFVMGARANKALGLGNMRGRLYVKHPDLFKYIGDQDDKQWLNENGLMPSTGGKAYLLVVRDIYDVAGTEEYKNSNCLQMDEIVNFKVPEWMIDKMKLQMKSHLATKGPKVKTKQAVDQDEDRLPFSSIYSGEGLLLDTKSDIQGSPATTDQMDLLSVDQEELDTPSVSPFNMTSGFTESSPLTSDLTKLEDEESLMASFEFQ